jgi:hypothetical protein
MANLKELMAKRQAAATQGDSTNEAAVPMAEAQTQPIATPQSPAASAPRVNAFAGRFAAPRSVAPTTLEPVVAPQEDDMDLEGFANLTDEGVAPRPVKVSQFADEMPATAPTRELPEDITKEMKQFVELIDGVYQILDDSELLGNVIRSIMIELKTYPQYMKMVSKEDVHQWVRAMRDSMGMARIKKQEKKRAPASKGKGAKIDSDMEQAFADLGVDLSGL